MGSVKIQSLKEVYKYKDQLEKIKIWVCSTSTGKSYLCNLDDRFFDLDQFQGMNGGTDDEACQKKVIDKMFEVIRSGR